MNNKELIEESNKRASEAISPDLFDYYRKVAKALQDAEADAKKQAAIHLDEEAKLLEEINRLKADLEYHVHNRNQLTKQLADAWNKINELKEDSRLRAVGDSQEINKENDRLKAKLSSQVDPIELIQYAMTTFMYYRCSDDRAKKILQQFKKERNE